MSDDFDDTIDADEGFDDFSSSSGLGGSSSQNPTTKIGIIVAAVVVIGGVLVYFGQDADKKDVSIIPAGSEITAVPGSNNEVAPAYIEAVEQQNEADLEAAIAQGGSAIPVPIETSDIRLKAPEIQEESEDPLHRWRLLQEERVNREMKAKETELEPVTVLNAEQQSQAINNLAESMITQMEAVLGSSNEDKELITKTLIEYKDFDDDGSGNGSGSGDSEGNSFTETTEEIVVIPAGKIVYGQMLLEANSDVPSVILAQMVSGPLKGWKLLGEFNLEEDIEMLTITFDMAVNEDGKQYEIDAIMLNPDTSLAALSTDVDHKYIRRIVLPAASAFIGGFAEAIADSGRTDVTVSGDTVVQEENEKSDDQEVATGVSEASEAITEIIDDIADVEVRVIIAAGTPIGIFFTDNVVEEEGDI